MILEHDEIKTRTYLKEIGVIDWIYDIVIDYVEVLELVTETLIIIQYHHKGTKKRYETKNLKNYKNVLCEVEQ